MLPPMNTGFCGVSGDAGDAGETDDTGGAALPGNTGPTLGCPLGLFTGRNVSASLFITLPSSFCDSSATFFTAGGAPLCGAVNDGDTRMQSTPNKYTIFTEFIFVHFRFVVGSVIFSTFFRLNYSIHKFT